MSAIPQRPIPSSTPSPAAQDGCIMPSLYQLKVGPVGAAYYQRVFARYEALGKPIPSWNNAAAFFTLAWLVLRKLRRPAVIYSGCLLVFALLWWALHGRVPLAMEAAVVLLLALLLTVIPGFLGNALYYQSVRNETMDTLGKSRNLNQAQVRLRESAITKERLHIVAAVQALVAAAITGVVIHLFNTTPIAPQALPASGPPNLVIPQVASITSQELTSFTPDHPLPVETNAAPSTVLPDIAPASTEVVPTTPADSEEPAAAAPAAESSPSDTSTNPAQPSIVEFAQTVPQASAVAGAVAEAATAAPAAPPRPPAPASTPAPAAAKTAPARSKPAVVAPAEATASKPAKTIVNPQAARAAATKAEPKGQEPPRGLIPGKYYLNAGVYAQAGNVDRAVKALQGARLNALRQTINSNKGEMTRLRIGPFDTREQAEQAAAKARHLRIETSVFQQPRK